MTVRELLKYGEQLAVYHHKESSAIKLLLMHFLNKESYELIANMDEEVKRDLELDYKKGVRLYIEDNIPIQHIMGYVYFYGHKFLVSPDVLIPRFETEELVAQVLACYDEYFNHEKVEVVDVGTGSGAIAITLSLEEENMTVDATDISEQALDVAKKNAQLLGANVHFLCGDMLQPLIDNGKKYDILVSNPPYIPKEEYVEALVKDNEPHVALYGGHDGMFFYEQILKNAHLILKPKNIIAFEHGWNQKLELKRLIKKYYKDAQYEIIQDMNGKDRITILYN